MSMEVARAFALVALVIWDIIRRAEISKSIEGFPSTTSRRGRTKEFGLS